MGDDAQDRLAVQQAAGDDHDSTESAQTAGRDEESTRVLWAHAIKIGASWTTAYRLTVCPLAAWARFRVKTRDQVKGRRVADRGARRNARDRGPDDR
jgi:hypothetical protein